MYYWDLMVEPDVRGDDAGSGSFTLEVSMSLYEYTRWLPNR
jgi:hypothetical protein